MKNFVRELKLAITNFGLSLENMQQRHHDWNEESKALGLVSDDEKLRILKKDLYSEARLSNANQQKILNLTGAIQLLEEIKHAKENKKLEKRKLWCNPVYVLDAWFNCFFKIACLTLVVGLSFQFLAKTLLNDDLCFRTENPINSPYCDNFIRPTVDFFLGKDASR